MTVYEEQFYMEFKKLVKIMQEISKDIKDIKNCIVPQTQKVEQQDELKD